MGGANNGELFELLGKGDTEAVRARLEADPALADARGTDGISALLFALYVGQPAAADLIHAARSELDVFEAAAMGDLEELRRHHAEDPDRLHAFAPDGFSPVHLAAFFGRGEALRLLLDAGADPDVAARSEAGMYPIHSAAASRDAAIVKTLLEAGADPNRQQHGSFTALHSAVLHGNEAMVEALIAAGADPSIADDEGQNAWAYLERSQGDAECLRSLLQA